MWSFEQGSANNMYQVSSQPPNGTVTIDLTSSSSILQSTQEDGGKLDALQKSSSSGITFANSDSQSSSNDSQQVKKKVPSIVHFLRMENGEEKKLGTLIFQAGKKYLTKKIMMAAEGIFQQKYSTAEHLDMLFSSFPETRQFAPDVLNKRIKSYISHARSVVKDGGTTGQGMFSSQTYNQKHSEEEELVELLNQANSLDKERIPENVKPKITTLEGTPMESLEEHASCIVCNKTVGKFHYTDLGEICEDCKKEQGGYFVDKSDLALQEEANIDQNRALYNMKPEAEKEKTKTEEGGEKRKRKRKRRDTSDDEDSSILTKMMIQQLGGQEEKQQIENESKRLENEKKKLELENMKLDIERKRRDLDK